MSSSDTLTLRDGQSLRTGYFLNELAVPLMRIMEAGFNPVFANPRGNMPAIDPRSDSALWFGGKTHIKDMAKRMLRELETFRSPHRIEDIVSSGVGEFSGLFVPGGHAPMEDLYGNRALGRVLEHFYEEGKPVGMICHGPVALLSTLNDPHAFVAALESGNRAAARDLALGWPYRGYRLTAFADFEELGLKAFRWLRGKKLNMRFTIEQALRACGAEYGSGLRELVRRDRELITAQGPLVADRFARLLVSALQEERATRIIRRAA